MELMLLPVTRWSAALTLGAALVAGCAAPAPAAIAPTRTSTPGRATGASAASDASAAPESQDRANGAAGEATPETTPPNAADEATTAQPPTREAAPEPPPTVPPDTKVLHIGDSMAGALGIELNKALAEAGAKGILRYKTASFIPTWAWSRDLPVLLANHDPDLVLITLGTNEIRIEDPTIRAKTIRKLVGRLEGRPCVWIAPPLWGRGDTGLLPVIRENCAPCVFMDTNALLPDIPRLRDKIHPTMKARRDWARFVLDWLARQRDPNGERPWDMKPVPPPVNGPTQ